MSTEQKDKLVVTYHAEVCQPESDCSLIGLCMHERLVCGDLRRCKVGHMGPFGSIEAKEHWSNDEY